MKRNSGITLIALVITIVIIIILASVTINFAFGDNGLINMAEEARDLAANSTDYESNARANLVAYMNEYIAGLNDGSSTEEPEQPVEKEQSVVEVTAQIISGPFQRGETIQIEANVSKGDGKIEYKVTAGTDVVSVSETGLITVLGDGSATIEVSVPETEKYAASDPVEIRITIYPTVVEPEKQKAVITTTPSRRGYSIRR